MKKNVRGIGLSSAAERWHKQAKVADRYMRMEQERLKGSTGVLGKLFENWGGCFASVNGRYVLRGHYFKSEAPGKADSRANRNIGIEFKTGCGVLAYNTDGVYEDELVRGCAVVIWVPYTDGLDENTAPDLAYVFSREQFIQCLYEMGSVRKSKGEFFLPDVLDKLSVTYHANRECVNITDFTRSAGKRWVLEHWLEQVPTFRTWVEYLNKIEGRG